HCAVDLTQHILHRTLVGALTVRQTKNSFGITGNFHYSNQLLDIDTGKTVDLITSSLVIHHVVVVGLQNLRIDLGEIDSHVGKPMHHVAELVTQIRVSFHERGWSRTVHGVTNIHLHGVEKLFGLLLELCRLLVEFTSTNLQGICPIKSNEISHVRTSLGLGAEGSGKARRTANDDRGNESITITGTHR